MDQFLILIMLGVVIAIILYCYYFFGIISIAIWLPQYSKPRWQEILQTPGVQVGFFFFKWIAPLCIILTIINLFMEAILRLLKWTTS
jgi:hypothetical protein